MLTNQPPMVDTRTGAITPELETRVSLQQTFCDDLAKIMYDIQF